MKKRHSFFAPLWLSWSPGDLYRDLARNGRGVGLLWLLFLTLGDTGVFTLQMAAVARQVPDVQIINGVFSTPGNQPVEIHDAYGRTVLAALLPTETSVPAKYSNTWVVVLGDRIVLHSSAGDTQEVKFDPQVNFPPTEGDPAMKSSDIWPVVPWVMAPFVLVGWWLGRLIYWLILSMTAVGANNASGGRFSYGALLRITAAAETPTILISMALTALGLEIPLVGLLYFVVTVVLLVLAVRTAARAEEPPPIESDRSATPPTISGS